MKKSKTKFNNIISKILPIILGIVLGYLLYYYLFMEIIASIIGSRFLYFSVSILCLIASIIGSIILFNLIFNKTINKKLFIIIYSIYLLVLFLVLFLRSYTEQVFIINPITSFLDIFYSSQMAIQTLLNFLIFVPLGYLFKNYSYKKLLLFSISISLLIELCQVFTMRGFFDTFDIILYFLGINTGYFIFKKLKLNIK